MMLVNSNLNSNQPYSYYSMKNGISYRKLSPKANTSMKKSLLCTNNSVYISPHCNRINLKKEVKHTKYLKTKDQPQSNIKVMQVPISNKIIQSQLFYSTKANSRSNIKSNYTKEEDKQDQNNLTFSFQNMNLELNSPKNRSNLLDSTKMFQQNKNRQTKSKKQSCMMTTKNNKVHKKTKSKINQSLKDISFIQSNQNKYQMQPKKVNWVVGSSSKTICYNKKQNEKKVTTKKQQNKANMVISTKKDKKQETKKSNIFLQSYGRSSIDKKSREIHELIQLFQKNTKTNQQRMRKISLKDLKQSHQKRLSTIDLVNLEQNNFHYQHQPSQIYQKTSNLLNVYKTKLQNALAQIQSLKTQNKSLRQQNNHNHNRNQNKLSYI